MKKTYFVLLIAAMTAVASVQAQTIVLSESFENGLPNGWTQEYVSGHQAWVFESGSVLAYPSTAVAGAGRAALRNTSGESLGYKTRLITPVMRLDTVFQPILRYYHAQMKWTADFDTLRVLYRTSAQGEWVLLQEFTQPVQAWTKETIDLPRVNATYQICFEGSENMGRGIVIDSVVVRSKPECTIPHDMSVTNMHKNTVTLNWLASYDALQYQLVLAKSDNAFDIDTIDIAAAKASGLVVKDTLIDGLQQFANLSGLNGNTNYVAFVRSICEQENSDWGVYPFYMKAIVPLPYTESFDLTKASAVAQLSDWAYGTSLSITTPYINCNQTAAAAAYYIRSGYALCFAGKTTPGSGADIAAGNYAYAATPMLDVADLTNVQVRFWTSLGNYGSLKIKARSIIVGVMEDAEDITTFVPVDTVTDWQYCTPVEHVVSLASYSGEGRYVAFLSRFDEANQIYIDDLTIEQVPAVPYITDIKVVPLATGAEFAWANVASAYNVIVSTKQTDDVESLTAAEKIGTATTTAATYVASGLSEGTPYYFYVQPQGGVWSSPKAFTTSWKKTLPMKFGFETTENYAIYTTEKDKPSIKNSASYAYAGSKCLTKDMEVGRDAWIAFPILDTIVQSVELEFYMRTYSTTYKNTAVIAGVMTDPADLTTFEPVATFTNTTTTYKVCYTDFQSYTGAGKYIALRWAEIDPTVTTKSYPCIDEVAIRALSECVVPKLEVTNITETTATLTWTARNMSSFQIFIDTENTKDNAALIKAYAAPSAAQYATPAKDVTTWTIPAGKLHWGRIYYAYIRSVIEESNVYSYWSQPVAFTMGVPALVSLPYTEDFDYYGVGADAMATGWSRISVDAYPQLSTSAKLSGTAGVYFKCALPARAGKLYVPVLDAADLNKVKISFDTKRGDSFVGNDSLRIGVSAAADTSAAITWLDTICIEKITGTVNYHTILKNWTAALGNHIVFQAYSYNGASRYFYLDNITFEALDGITPFDFATDDEAETSAVISWKGESAAGWKVVVTTEETNPDTIAKLAEDKIVIKDQVITTNPFRITGLTAETSYWIYLCPVNDSVWSAGYNFWTSCVKLVPNSSKSRMGFEGYVEAGSSAITSYAKSTFPHCWTRHGADETNATPSNVPFICVAKSGSTPPTDYSHTGLSCAKLHASTGSAGPSWFTTPEINAKNMANVSVSLWTRAADGQTLPLYVGVMTNPDDWNTLTVLYTYEMEDTKSWYNIDFNLGSNGYKDGMGKYIAFATSGNLTHTTSFYIDDIEISESTCTKPYPTLSKLTDNSVRLAYASTPTNMRMILVQDTLIVADSLNAENGADYLARFKALPNVMYDSLLLSKSGLIVDHLQGDTLYSVALQTQCEDDDESLWVVTSFQTLCTPQTVGEMGTIHFEESEDFVVETNAGSSAAHQIPCWTIGKKGAADNLYIPYVCKGTASPDGDACLKFRAGTSSDQNGAYAIMPAVDVDSITRLQVSFIGRAMTSTNCTKPTSISAIGNYAGSIIVGIVTDPSDISTFVAVDTVSFADNDVHNALVRFNTYRGDAEGSYGKHVAFLSEFAKSNNFIVDAVQLDTIPACGAPLSISVDSVTDATALVSWKGINATYRIMVSTTDLASSQWDKTADYILNDTVSADSCLLKGLDGNTTYYVYVKALGADGEGAWCLESTAFTTGCPDVAVLPYKDNFDRYTSGTGYYPACWRRFYNGKEDAAASYPYINSSAKYGTEGNGLHWTYSSSYTAETKRPIVATLPISGDLSKTTLSFKIRTASSASNPSGIIIGYATDVTNLDSLLQTVQYVDTVYPLKSSTDWTEIIRSMDDCSGENAYIVLTELCKSTTAIYMDDFKVEKTPTCYVPSVVVDSIGAEVVKVQIAPYFPTDNAWNVRAISEDLEDTVFVAATDTFCYLQGLQSGTNYNLYVQTNCGADDLSDWSEYPVAFRTLFKIGAGTCYTFEKDDNLETRGSSSTNSYTIPKSLYAYNLIEGRYHSSVQEGAIYARTGTGAFDLFIYNASWAPTFLALPEIMGSDSLQIRFDMRAAEAAAGDEAVINRAKTFPFAELEIGLIDADYDLTSFQSLATYRTTDYQDGEAVTAAKNALFDQVVFPMPTGIKDKFVVLMMRQTANLDMYIDNLYVEKKQGYQTPVIGQTTITPTSLTLNWDANGSTKWNVYLTDSANLFPIDSVAEKDILKKQTVTTNSATFAELLPNHTYFAYVQVADQQGLGATSARRTFRTPIEEFVQSDSIITFEDTLKVRSVVPAYWYVGNDASAVALQQPGALLNGYNETAASASAGVIVSYQGARALQLYGEYTGKLGAYAAMPQLDADFDTIQVNFYARPFAANASGKVSVAPAGALLVVGTMTDPNNPNTFVAIDSFTYSNSAVTTSEMVNNLTNQGWERFAFRLKGAAGKYIAFSAPYSKKRWYIDNISFGERTCLTPKSLSATNITGHTATLSWRAADDDIENILQVSTTTDFTAENLVFVDTVLAQQAVATGLEGTTTYYYRVRQACSDENSWSVAQSFTTECAEIDGSYSDSFENTDKHILLPGVNTGYYQPQCWTVGTTCGNIIGTTYRSINSQPKLQQSTSTAYYSHNTASTGLKDLYALKLTGNWISTVITVNNYMNYYDQWIAMPALENVDADTLQLSFYALPGAYNPTTGTIASGGTGLKTVIVGVMSDPNDLSTFVDLDTCTYSYNLTSAVATAANEYMAQRFDISLSGIKGHGNYIAFRTNTEDWIAAHPEYEGTIASTLYLDDISLELLNACPMPTALTASDITLTSAQLSWSGEEDATFVLDISTDEFFADGFVVANKVLTDTSYLVTALDTFTTYYWRVSTQCSATQQSKTAGEQFTTLRVPMYHETFVDAEPYQRDWSWSETRAKDVFAGADMKKASLPSYAFSGWIRTEKTIGLDGVHVVSPLNSCNDTVPTKTSTEIAKKKWMFTPVIVLDDTKDAQLAFDLALTYYQKDKEADQTGWDDQFMVVVSDDGGKTWKRENATVWNNETTNDETDTHYVYGKGDYVLNEIPNHAPTNSPISIDLSAYKGKTVKVGFYTESMVLNAHNSLHVGNVHINYYMRDEENASACMFEDLDSENGLFHIDGDKAQPGTTVWTKTTLATPEQVEAEPLKPHWDTLYVFKATYSEAPQVVINKTICEGEEAGAEWGFANHAESGVYTRKGISTVTGCDSITTLNLTVLPRLYSTIEETICSGTSFEFNGKPYSKTGVYVDTLSSLVTGCDSITKLVLTVNPPITSSVAAYICSNSSYYFTPKYPALTMSGTYLDTVKTVEGCDSIVTLKLVVSDVINISVFDTICEGQSVSFEGAEYSATGVYPVTFQSVAGCDSVRTLYLTIMPTYKDTIVASICPGRSYTEHGFNESEAGIYSLTETSRFGCDSVIVLNLSLYDTDTIRVDTTIQVSDLPYFYTGTQITYPLSTVAGTYVDTITVKGADDRQCDYILIHKLTILEGDGVDNVAYAELTLTPTTIPVGGKVIAIGEFGPYATIDVFDMVGRCIKHDMVEGSAIQIDGFYVAGLYTVRIMDAQGQQFVGRVLVK